MKVAVLGASGMLGSTVLDVFKTAPDLELIATARKQAVESVASTAQVVLLDAETCTQDEIVRVLTGCDWAVNCIGLIKHHMVDHQAASSERAIRINALFPHILSRAAEESGCRVIQIATDCVYSGARGSYRESDPHDALDVYGKSKSLGEVHAQQLHHLRCSIIGPELKDRLSLLEWFLGHPQGALVRGFSNHYWNGLTTLHFAKICMGVMRDNIILPNLCHITPGDVLTKGELLETFQRSFGRADIRVDIQPAPQAVDRSLATSNPELNEALWVAAGYSEPPTLAQMVKELAEWAKSSRRRYA